MPTTQDGQRCKECWVCVFYVVGVPYFIFWMIVLGIFARKLIYLGTLDVIAFVLWLGPLVLFCLVLSMGSFTPREALILSLWPANGGMLVLITVAWFRLFGLFIGLTIAVVLFVCIVIPFVLFCLIDQSTYCLGNSDPRCIGHYLVKVENMLERRRDAGERDVQNGGPPVARVVAEEGFVHHASLPSTA